MLAWLGKWQWISQKASGEYPALQKQRDLMVFMLSETVDRWGEWWCISTLCLVHSISVSCRAQAGLAQQQLESLLLLTVHKKSILTSMLTLLPGSNVLSLMTTVWWLLNGEHWEPTGPVRDPDVWKQQVLHPSVSHFKHLWHWVVEVVGSCLSEAKDVPLSKQSFTSSCCTSQDSQYVNACLCVHAESKWSAAVSLSPFWHWSSNHSN